MQLPSEFFTATLTWRAYIGSTSEQDKPFNVVSLDAYSYMSRTLTIPGGVLQKGQVYTFIVGAVWKTITGSASATVNVYAGPRGGSCASSALSGTAFTTSFVLSCSQWNDDTQFLPLQYKFSIVSAKETKVDGVSKRSEAGSSAAQFKQIIVFAIILLVDIYFLFVLNVINYFYNSYYCYYCCH